MGLERLGLDVWFVEQLTPRARARLAPRSTGSATSPSGSGSPTARRSWVRRAGRSLGPALARAASSSPPTASLVNISGHLHRPAAVRRLPPPGDDRHRPGLHAVLARRRGSRGANVDGHDIYFTIGELIGTPGCPIPTGGIDWRPVRQPVVLDDWPVRPAADADRFTTVASWRGPFGPIEHERPHLRAQGARVPQVHRAAASVAAAVRARPRHPPRRRRGPSNALRGARVGARRPATASPATRRLSRLRAGLGRPSSRVAQGVYVDTACGWFSDRTVRYLASGRPALVQDTGFGGTIRSGRGWSRSRTLDGGRGGRRRTSSPATRSTRWRRARSRRRTLPLTSCCRGSATRRRSADRPAYAGSGTVSSTTCWRSPSAASTNSRTSNSSPQVAST